MASTPKGNIVTECVCGASLGSPECAIRAHLRGPRLAEDRPARHRAEHAEKTGEGICRTCLAPIWNEGGTVGHRRRDEGWSDRVERCGDSLVCFKAVEYRHVPLTGREACIYDEAFKRGAGAE